ncbi:MAG: hypothetical protein ACLFP4_05765 [Spirochaetales bacterium]
MSNPVLEESAAVYLRRREYLLLHSLYLIVSAVFVLMVWPARSYMYFFRTETVPAAFLATTVFHVLALAGVNMYIGMDRLANTEIIRYSEWLERTSLPVRALAAGKLAAGLLHSLFLTLLAAPFLVVAAGPSGVTITTVTSLLPLLFLTGFACRVAGQVVSHLGEESYFVRTIAGWFFMVLLFLLSIQVYQPINPIVVVTGQLQALEPGVDAAGSPAIPLWEALLALALLTGGLILIYWVGLTRHRHRAERGANG